MASGGLHLALAKRFWILDQGPTLTGARRACDHEKTKAVITSIQESNKTATTGKTLNNQNSRMCAFPA